MGKPLHFLFCSGSWSISSGHCGLTQLTLQFNVQLKFAFYTKQYLTQLIEVLVPVVLLILDVCHVQALWCLLKEDVQHRKNF